MSLDRTVDVLIPVYEPDRQRYKRATADSRLTSLKVSKTLTGRTAMASLVTRIQTGGTASPSLLNTILMSIPSLEVIGWSMMRLRNTSCP